MSLTPAFLEEITYLVQAGAIEPAMFLSRIEAARPRLGNLKTEQWRERMLGYLHEAQFRDSDANEISDYIEHQTDSDGDGFSNFSEFTVGTNPVNPSSHPQILPW